MNLHGIIKEAKFKYLSNRVEWPSIKMIHNMEELNNINDGEQNNFSRNRDKNFQQLKHKHEIYLPIDKTNSERKKKKKQ